MSKEIITIKNEKALLEYLYKRLSLGYTAPITEDEYFRFIKLFEERVNSIDCLERVAFEKESFTTIFEKAMEMLNKNGSNNGKQALEYIDADSVKKVCPTYELKPIEYGEYRMIENSRQMVIARTLMEQLTPRIELSTYDFIKFDSLDVAEKVASFYINDIINRYIQDMVRLGVWSSEFTDVDKYIFEQNFTQTFNGLGTREAFINAYIHATRILSELKDNATSDEIIMFSNNPNKVLAYANYLKMFLPEQLKFLVNYSHKPYALNDAAIDAFVTGKNVHFQSVACISCDEEGYWADAYDKEEYDIVEEPVKVMKKRLRNTIDYQ